MQCPFETPVEKEISTQDASGKTYYRIIDANKRSIAAGLIEKNADYIVQAINCHEKLVEAFGLARSMILSGEKMTKQAENIFEQALKEEAEKT